MANDLGGPSPAAHLLRSVAQDFEALSAVIERAIIAKDGALPQGVERLHRAKHAADKAAVLAKRPANFL
jgi:hypothetical protein